uniref:Uncharacterized protein n=1 Tax=Rhizophora mucronata TaxID=61149 RepID=A0A2P2LUI6_RHIMU
MAVQNNNSSFFLTKSAFPAIFPWSSSSSWKKKIMNPASVVNVASSSSSSTATSVWLRIDGGFGGRSKVRLAFALGGSSDSSSSSSNNNTSSSNRSRGGGGPDGSNKKKGPAGVPNSNYVVPLDKSLSSSYLSCITRPLAEILRDLNKRIPDNIIKPSPSLPHQSHSSATPIIPWYHANRMLSFYAPVRSLYPTASFPFLFCFQVGVEKFAMLSFQRMEA